MKYEDIVNEIISLGQIKSPKYELSNYKNIFRSIVINDNLIFVIIDYKNYDIYQKNIEVLYFSNSQLQNSYSLGSFESQFIKFIHPFICDCKPFESRDFKVFINELLKIDSTTYKVISGLSGLMLDTPFKPLSLGPFTIYNYKHHKNIYADFSKSNFFPLSMQWYEEYFIILQVEAREPDKAKEIAEDMFSKLNYFIRFLTGTTTFSKFNFGVNIIDKRNHSKMIISNENSISTFEDLTHGNYPPIPLDSTFFTNPSIGGNYYWSLLNFSSKSEIENKIISAIVWSGKALEDYDLNNQFLQYIFSFESLLTYQEKTFITPSVVSQLAEGFALLLGSSKIEKIQIDKDIKNLYNHRSAIVHGAHKPISQYTLEQAKHYSNKLITKFFNDEKLRDIKTTANFIDFIKHLKYS